MKIFFKNIHVRNIYNFFLVLSSILFFFSTEKIEAKTFNISNIEISKPFILNFNKYDVLDEGFKKAFSELISIIVNSEDKKKIENIKLNEVKGMIETFSIKEEKFINEIYYVNLGVSFNKKKIFNFLEKKSIFPSIPNKKSFLFIPIIIDEQKKDLLIFSENLIFENWNKNKETNQLIEYILPTEDLEDINLIKKNYENIEQYNFKEITDKYFLKDSIIALIFKNETELRILSRITIKDSVSLRNQSFNDTDITNLNEIEKIINQLKISYEDYWKKSNQINTSIKLPLLIKVNSSNNLKISAFEKILDNMDLVYNYSILKYDKNFIFYQVTFNGTPNIFLKSLGDKNYFFDTQNKIWILK